MDASQEIWAEIRTLNLKAGDKLPLMELVTKLMNETEYEPDEIAEGFEALADKGWLEERDDTAYLTQAGFVAL